MNLDQIAKGIRQEISKRQKELQLEFFEEEHIYTMKDVNGELKSNFPSVSKVLKQFYKQFPTEEAAYNKAGGDPDKQKQLIEEWAAAGRYSTNLGSRVHFELEKQVIKMHGDYKDVRQPIFECDLTQLMKSDNMITAGKRYLELMKQRGACLLDTEMVLGDPELGYTGQPDKVWLMENRDKSEIGFVITDWKTNKPKNFQETDFTNRMYPPFSNYPDNALGHYFVQLPLYGKLLLKMLSKTKYSNIKLFGCVISHLREDTQFEEFRVPRDVVNTVLEMDISSYLKTK
jgi:hypothetical protein